MSANAVASRLINHTHGLTWDWHPRLKLSSHPRLKPTEAKRVGTPKSEVGVHGIAGYSRNAAVCA